MVLEWLSNIGYKGGHEMNAYMLGMNYGIESIKGKKVFLLGAGVNGFIASSILYERGIEIAGFIDNNEKLVGKSVGGKRIFSLYDMMGESIYIIITVEEKYIAEVRLQLMVKQIYDYSIFFRMHGHSFASEDKVIHNIIIDGINNICLRNEEPTIALPYQGFSLGGDGAKLGNLNWLIKSTEWSHPGYHWMADIFEKNKELKVLEIGPGYGLLSYYILRLYENAKIDWLLFSESNKEELDLNNPYDKGLSKIKEMYSESVNYRFGMIEIDDDLVEEKYDLVLMTEVFEHFALNPIQTMKKIKKYLNNNGKMLLTTPNWGHLPTMISYKELPDKKDVTLDRYKELLSLGHVYQYSKNEMIEILEKAGFTVDKYEISESNNHNFLLS